MTSSPPTLAARIGRAARATATPYTPLAVGWTVAALVMFAYATRALDLRLVLSLAGVAVLFCGAGWFAGRSRGYAEDVAPYIEDVKPGEEFAEAKDW